MVSPFRLLSASCLTLASITAALAQDGIPSSNFTDVGKPFVSKKSDIDKMINGLDTPRDKNDRDLLDLAARYYAYKLQWITVKDDPVALSKHLDELERDLIRPLLGETSSKTNSEARNLLGKNLAMRFEEVLKLDFVGFRPSVMHAALSLPKLARLKSDDLGDLLTRLAADKDKHDAIKLYAFKSMKDYFPVRVFNDEIDDPDNNKLKLKKARDLARIDALVKFIEAKRPTPANQGEVDAIRFVRREAIKALALAQAPALAALKKGGAVEGAIAPTLMRVIIQDGVEPKASLSEKVEAAIGLCHMKFANMPAYQPEMGVYMVGRLLDEYARTYGGEFINLKKRTPAIAWKIDSERLRLALDDLEKNTEGTSAKAKANTVAREGRDFLSYIKAHENLSNPNKLRAVAEKVRPSANNLFIKGFKGPEFDPGD